MESLSDYQTEMILRKPSKDGGNPAGLQTVPAGVTKTMILPRKTCQIDWPRFPYQPLLVYLFALEW
jgi:hypothetical protein